MTFPTGGVRECRNYAAFLELSCSCTQSRSTSATTPVAIVRLAKVNRRPKIAHRSTLSNAAGGDVFVLRRSLPLITTTIRRTLWGRSKA
jgi:hypothetical protein